MKPLAWSLAFAIGVSACAAVVVQGPATTEAATTTTTTTSLAVTPTTTSPAATNITEPSGPPVAWISPNGVPMAVTAVEGDVIEALTPCGDQIYPTEGTPIHEVEIVIDPGHGGPIDTGAVAPTGLAEQEINRKVSLAVAQLLTRRGIPTLLTRVADYPIPIPIRTGYADLVGAKALVSIHHNAPAAPAADVPGVEIFIQNESDDSARLGGLLYETTMASLGQFDVDWDRAPDAGVMTVLNPEGLDTYGMIRLPETVSALIELGYVANRAEAVLYAGPEYVPAAANAIADAIEKYLTTDQSGSGFVDGRVFRANPGVGRDQCIDVDLESALYPDILDVNVVAEGAATYRFEVTMSSEYDTADRYADAWRVIGGDGIVYVVHELTHGHANEQPFTRLHGGVAIPPEVSIVTVEGHDQVYGWGGQSGTAVLP